MTTPNQQSPSVTQSLDRAMRLLELVVSQTQHGVDLQGLVAMSGLKRPTVHRLLTGLRNAGLVSYDTRTRRYLPAYKLYEMGMMAGQRFDVRLLALPSLERLATETCDTVHLSVRHGDASLCVARTVGSYPIRTLTLEVGDTRPLGLGAGSLALLAAMPDDDIHAVIERNREALAKHPNFAAPRMMEHVEITRQQGYALNDGQMLPEMAGIAVAIREPYGSVCGALSIAAIRSRLQPPRREQVLDLMRREVVLIEEQLAKA